MGGGGGGGIKERCKKKRKELVWQVSQVFYVLCENELSICLYTVYRCWQYTKVDEVEERMITEESEGLIDRLTPLARLLEYIYKLDLDENSNLIILIFERKELPYDI